MRRLRGFSLIEMVVAISIILIIAAIGVLNYARQKANNGVTVSVQIVASDLKMAKDIASTSANGAEIDFGPAAGNGVTPVVIKQNGGVVRTDNLPGQATLSTSWGSNAIVFQQNGTTDSFGSNSINGIITVGSKNTKTTKQIQVVPYTGAILK